MGTFSHDKANSAALPLDQCHLSASSVGSLVSPRVSQIPLFYHSHCLAPSGGRPPGLSNRFICTINLTPPIWLVIGPLFAIVVDDVNLPDRLQVSISLCKCTNRQDVLSLTLFLPSFICISCYCSLPQKKTLFMGTLSSLLTEQFSATTHMARCKTKEKQLAYLGAMDNLAMRRLGAENSRFLARNLPPRSQSFKKLDLSEGISPPRMRHSECL